MKVRLRIFARINRLWNPCLIAVTVSSQDALKIREAIELLHARVPGLRGKLTVTAEDLG